MRDQLWPWLRCAAAVLIVAALVGQLGTSVEVARTNGRDVLTAVANFFSFFTVLSNLLAALTLGWAGVAAIASPNRTVGPPPALLACVTTAMLMTGVVYNLLLRGIELPQGTTLPWSNEVLHVVGPAFLLIDLLFAPAPRRLAWSSIGWILAYPLVWTVYTMVRGPLVTNPTTGEPSWYPYPFLNPDRVAGGWAGVAVYMVGIAIGMGVVGAVVIAVSRRRTRGRQG